MIREPNRYFQKKWTAERLKKLEDDVNSMTIPEVAIKWGMKEGSLRTMLYTYDISPKYKRGNKNGTV